MRTPCPASEPARTSDGSGTTSALREPRPAAGRRAASRADPAASAAGPGAADRAAAVPAAAVQAAGRAGPSVPLPTSRCDGPAGPTTAHHRAARSPPHPMRVASGSRVPGARVPGWESRSPVPCGGWAPTRTVSRGRPAGLSSGPTHRSLATGPRGSWRPRTPRTTRSRVGEIASGRASCRGRSGATSPRRPGNAPAAAPDERSAPRRPRPAAEPWTEPQAEPRAGPGETPPGRRAPSAPPRRYAAQDEHPTTPTLPGCPRAATPSEAPSEARTVAPTAVHPIRRRPAQPRCPRSRGGRAASRATGRRPSNPWTHPRTGRRGASQQGSPARRLPCRVRDGGRDACAALPVHS